MLKLLGFKKYKSKSEKVFCKMIDLATHLYDEDLVGFADYLYALKEERLRRHKQKPRPKIKTQESEN